MLRYCVKCQQFKQSDGFNRREDRAGYYGWCKDCMDEQCRSLEHPPIKYWGGGRLPTTSEIDELIDGR